ncbi:lipid asymmetry maintenance protein MlaB [Citrobacter sp. JGM124]|uniref:lipid asymmetry maintenance protein MlaB n=1 Tax=Citrobacter sp. JGM124 TaxID=2799789 RepID=UPI001BAB7D6C|nr:lipid asymmetry maintenance protein MlaB [Citrobacter sp. JGM124]MBS0849606.1 lipid asymmetry maintenance protein MlaB [Citrobacter sp. JGM124]
MAASLSWQRNAQVLSLSGELNSENLSPLWEQRKEVVMGVTTFDLSALTRVDTAGLALLIHLVAEAKKQGNEVELYQISENLQTLVQLYNLPESLIPRRTA